MAGELPFSESELLQRLQTRTASLERLWVDGILERTPRAGTQALQRRVRVAFEKYHSQAQTGQTIT